MTESLDRLDIDRGQLVATREIADLAMTAVIQKYGTGFPHFRGGEEANLPFHSGYHTVAVPRDALRVGRALGFSLPEMTTAYVAGRAHDIVQLKPRGVMEQESADWFVEQMRQRGLPQVMAEAGALAILGTEPVFEGNVLVGQKAHILVTDYGKRLRVWSQVRSRH